MSIMEMEIDIHRIKSEMAQKDINQSQLADMIGVSRQLLSLWMIKPHRINLEKAGRIADALGLDGRDLIISNRKRIL